MRERERGKKKRKRERIVGVTVASKAISGGCERGEKAADQGHKYTLL